MNGKQHQPDKAAGLRKRAEEQSRQHAAPDPATMSPEDVRRTLHELRVHQIELETQNEELRKAQAELEASRARYFDLYDLAPAGYVTVSEKGRILEANLTAAGLLGKTRRALAKQPFPRFILNEDQDIYDHHRKVLFETGAAQTCELRMVKQEGAPFWARLDAAATQDEDGADVCRIVMTDITERKRAEEALREGEARLAELNQLLAGVLEYTHMLTAFLDPQFNFIWVNRAYADASRHETSFFPGKDHFDLYPHEENQVIFQRVVDTGEPFFAAAKPFEYPEEPERGLTHWDWSLIPVKDDSGKVTGLVFTLAEVTERIRAEEEKIQLERRIRQIEKAESLGRMAGAVAHRFNNQLHIVLGNLELVLEDSPADGPQRQALTEALQAVKSSAETSGLMLTYLGQGTEKGEPIDLSDVCRRNLPPLRGAIALETDFMDTGPIVRTSAGQIQQVLTLLSTNAAEAIGDNGGKIAMATGTISTDNIPKTQLVPPDWKPAADSYAFLEVTDSGCGIAKRDLNKIFDPFFSTKFSGRGLGLAVVLGIARQWGGAVNVESTRGDGTTFRVFLPLVDDAVPQVSQKVTAVRPIPAGDTVLLVDDEDMVRNMAERTLKRLGCSVIAASSGTEALELFNHHRDEIGCVITDLTMPGMDGWETIAALRRIDTDIPIILASGYDEAEVMGGGQFERPQVFLHKPYALADLKAALAAVRQARRH